MIVGYVLVDVLLLGVICFCLDKKTSNKGSVSKQTYTVANFQVFGMYHL